MVNDVERVYPQVTRTHSRDGSLAHPQRGPTSGGRRDTGNRGIEHERPRGRRISTLVRRKGVTASESRHPRFSGRHSPCRGGLCRVRNTGPDRAARMGSQMGRDRRKYFLTRLLLRILCTTWDTFDEFYESVIDLSPEQQLRGAIIELWKAAYIHQVRYRKLRTATRRLPVAIGFLLVTTALTMVVY